MEFHINCIHNKFQKNFFVKIFNKNKKYGGLKPPIKTSFFADAEWNTVHQHV